ncbi:hypothetical protein ACKWTF_004560 [Chironomus riparius]
MENYFTSIEPFYRVAKIFGLFPMNFEEPVRKGNLNFTKISIVRTIGTFALLIAMNCMIIHNHITYQSENQPFLSLMVWSWFLILVYPIIIIQLIVQVYKIKDIRKFLHFMHQIDLKFRQLNIQINHKVCHKKIFYITMFAIGTMLIRFLASTIYAFKKKTFVFTQGNMIIQEICYLCFLFYQCFFTLQFIIPTYLVKKRFEALKDLLRYERFNEQYLNLQLYAKTFHDLCDAIESINNLFAFHLVPILLTMLIVNVFGMYSIFKYLSTPGTTSLYLATAYVVSMHLILMILTAHIGSTTSREPEKLIEMIAKLINDLSLNHPSRFVLYNYVKQFQTRNFNFQALFLTINWNFVLGTTSTTVTYLIIICQFQSPLVN